MYFLCNKSVASSFILKSLLFVLIFSYFFPIEFVFLPFSTIRIPEFLGMVGFVYLLFSRLIPKSLLYVYVCGILIVFVGVCSTSVLNNSNDYSLLYLKGVYLYLYSFSSFVIVMMARKVSNKQTFYVVLEWLVFISLIYAVISFVFYLYPDFYTLYTSFIRVDNDSLYKAERGLSFRLIGLSNKVNFANAAVHYGIAIWAVILLLKYKFSFFYNHKIIANIAISVFSIAGILSGRTFFILLVMTVLLIYLLYKREGFIYSLNKSIVLFIPLIIVVFVGVAYLAADNSRMIEWAFELFLNSDNGMQTESTDVLKDMWAVLPDNLHTWWFGDGMYLTELGFYKGTDVGYLRNVFYWGLIGSFTYYSCLYFYYRMIKKETLNKDIVIYAFMILLFYYIYNIKDAGGPEHYLILILVSILHFPAKF